MAAEVEGLSYANAAHLARTGVPWWGTGTSAKETQYDHWLSDDEVKAEIGFDVDVKPLFRQNEAGVFVPLSDAQETVRIDWLDQFTGVCAYDLNYGFGLTPRPCGRRLTRTDATGWQHEVECSHGAEVDPDSVIKRQVPNYSHIATVGSDYKPFPGTSLVDFGSEIVDEYGEKWDTAGRLRGDRIIFATIRLDHLASTGALVDFDGSTYYNWLLLATSHDGSMALQAAVVKYRTVCKNTYNAGLSSAKSSFSIRHSGDIAGRAQEARRVLGVVTKQDAEFNKVAERLATSAFELDEYEALAEHLFPVVEGQGDRAKATRIQHREQVKSNWLNTPTVNDDIRFTKWGILNGVTEWAEHKRPQRKTGLAQERRVLSTLFGGPVQKIRESTLGYLTTPGTRREVVNA